MGFEGKKVLTLQFDDPDLDGLEVVTRCPSIEQVLAKQVEAEKFDEDDTVASTRLAAELFCDSLIGWNLENDGVEVPHTAEALLEQDIDVAQSILEAFEQHAFKVSPGKERSSSDGPPSVAASLPMEPLSESLAS